MITIKQAEKNDYEILALLGRTTWKETFAALFRRKEDAKNYADHNFSISMVKSFLKNPNAHFWIAYVNEFPVGYAKIEMHTDSEFVKGKNTCKLHNFYVLNDFHSMKIGLKLWNKILEKVKEQKCDNMWLSVLHTNDKAIQFYKENNFNRVANYDFEIGIDSFLMHIMVREFK
ncbi:GNAT family N-acetyltransferase [Winogradskyella helgolandensis]|uniref:GNAT family N-acetyltransferase n=1 Tax=Winogradskyella helgolandensis TaxID=2697010 RepID=UPI001E304364|nr:GNAT family N-acetyltransferase [Winogradskyella helgolandensis]